MSNSLSASEKKVVEYYNRSTDEFFIKRWHEEHIHFGLFAPGETVRLDQPVKRVVGMAVERMLEAVIQPAMINSEDVVVDAGSGIGGTALKVAKRHGSRVIGLNICEYQNDIARSRATEAGLADVVQFVYADCSTSLPLSDESVDVIINIESACHYTDRYKFLSECKRILKPGGRLVAQDWMAARGTSKKLSQEIYSIYIQPLCNAWFMESLETKSGYTKMLCEVGFEIVEFVDFAASALPNAYIIEAQYKKLANLVKTHQLSDTQCLWMEQFRTLSAAWLAGYFQLQRYFVRKN